jgi:hypothetical protein
MISNKIRRQERSNSDEFDGEFVADADTTTVCLMVDVGSAMLGPVVGELKPASVDSLECWSIVRRWRNPSISPLKLG